jgi:dienelactone hydrolase
MSDECKISEKLLIYNDSETILEGFVAYPEKIEYIKPGILINHEWTGIGNLVKSKAVDLAKMGYIAMCADIYGKGVRPKHPEEALKISNLYKNNRKLLRNRLILALNELKKIKGVDCEKLAVIGFCFGGMAALELARASAEIKGAVSFHGSLSTPEEFKAKSIQAKILVLHGSEDPLIPHSEVLAFINEMRTVQADWQLHIYGGAYHSFMNPESGDNRDKGIAYNEKIASRAWIHMLSFFDEIFK